MQLSANQKVAFKLSIVGLLIVAAVFSRFWLADWPNFKPVAAVAIFAASVASESQNWVHILREFAFEQESQNSQSIKEYSINFLR